MAMLSFGGIDVSKDRLDVMVLPEEQCSSVSNDAAGWAELVEQLRGSSICGDRHRGERRLRAWCHACLARGRHARAPGQSVQAAAVRQGERGSGEERSTRCPHDCVVRRHHADTSSAARRRRQPNG